MPEPWEDSQTSILYFRKRIPTRLKAIFGRAGDTIKIGLGASD
jgi:hypothetical protein